MADSRTWIDVMTRNLALILLLLLASCQRQDANDARILDPENLAREYAVVEQLIQAREHPSDNNFSGKWIEGDGARICDGYLTRWSNEEFCAADIPDDWTPFEFNGQTYYRQLLAEDKEQR